MAYKIKSKKNKFKYVSNNEIRFKTEAEAKKFLKQLKNLSGSTYSYFRKGKTIYRY
jgi:hypothetical protein